MHSKPVETIAIFGGSGFLGQLLASFLKDKNYNVIIFSRNSKNNGSYLWNPILKQFPVDILSKIDHIINLSGANLMNKNWTAEYKKILIESRTIPTRFIKELLTSNTHHVKSVINASGISIYGDRGNVILTEKDEAGTGFLEKLCVKWEKEAEDIRKIGIRTNILRISPVVHRDNNFIKDQLKFAKYGLLGSIGKGEQYIPWVHYTDLLEMFLFLIKNESCNTVFNACTSTPITQKHLNGLLSLFIDQKQFAPAIPTKIFKLFFGEKSHLITDSILAIPQNFLDKNFEFHYPKIEQALENL